MIHPVQTQGPKRASISSKVTKAAYEVYCYLYGPQPAMMDLEDRGCRGGFSAGELLAFLYARAPSPRRNGGHASMKPSRECWSCDGRGKSPGESPRSARIAQNRRKAAKRPKLAFLPACRLPGTNNGLEPSRAVHPTLSQARGAPFRRFAMSALPTPTPPPHPRDLAPVCPVCRQSFPFAKPCACQRPIGVIPPSKTTNGGPHGPLTR